MLIIFALALLRGWLALRRAPRPQVAAALSQGQARKSPALEVVRAQPLATPPRCAIPRASRGPAQQAIGQN